MFAPPLELPVNPQEAAAAAEVLLQGAERERLNDDVRQRAGTRLRALRLTSFTPFPESIEQDPIHPSTFYMAADTAKGEALLLRLARASSPASGLFPKAVLIGRVRTASGQEVVTNAIPFGPGQGDAIRTFAEKVNPAFLPRAQGAQPTVAVIAHDAAASLPAAFRAFKNVLKATRKNVAAIEAPGGGGSILDAAPWAAIRGGWREGYTAGTWQPGAAGYTKLMLRFESEAAAAEAYDQFARGREGRSRWFDCEIAPGAASASATEMLLARFRDQGRAITALRFNGEPGADFVEAAQKFNVRVTVPHTAAGPRRNCVVSDRDREIGSDLGECIMLAASVL